MKFIVPQPLQNEHGALDEQPPQGTRAEGEVGEAAKAAARPCPAAIRVGRVARQRLGARAAGSA